MNACIADNGINPFGGDTTETWMAGTVIFAVPVLVVSVTDVAVTVTLKSLGGRPGAVYVTAAPLALEVGDTLPQGVGEQATAHVTPPLLVSLPTVAVNC